QRFGAELNGPLRRHGSDFALTLEHREVYSVAAINAVTLAPDGTTQPYLSTVETPESRWAATARTAWQISPRNTFIASYSAVDRVQNNQGLTGNVLPEGAYDAHKYEHVIRLTNVTTATEKLMHEARVSLDWNTESDTPRSTAPQVQVAGAFTGGGAANGAYRLPDFGIEILDDAILTTARHTLKVGTDFRIYRERDRLTQNFNGSYIFGGGSAPVLDASGRPVAGQMETITGLEQYGRAQRGQAGGTPTAYTVVTGDPAVNFTQVRAAFFVQDQYKLRPNLQLAFGLRYFFQTDPTLLLNLLPRVGLSWSPDKKQRWTLRLHGGLFNGNYDTEIWDEVLRQDGVRRVTSTIYNPVYGNPFVGATPVHTVRTVVPGFGPMSFDETQFEVDHTLGRGWSVMGNVYQFHEWNVGRSLNVNQPLDGSPTGARPGAPNLNELQLQASGKGGGWIIFSSVNHNSKYANINYGYVWIHIRDTSDNNSLLSPQNALSDAGEYVARTRQRSVQMFGTSTLHLPRKVDLALEYNIANGRRWNVTTGFDNNGDGNFNDRPQYARPGDPNAVATPFGLLVATGGAGVFPRNAGQMPWRIGLDANLTRTFALTRQPKSDHVQTLTANVRAANVLNHTNVTQVGGVLGSPQFGLPYAADQGRRVEGGLRYSF
ncbi:MAG TPA: TonB-dependent receptor, partial [Burkholderiaceae bacterium]